MEWLKSPIHKSVEMLTVTLRHLQLADFGDSNVIRLGKYAELCELSLKSDEMKIKPVS